MNKQRREAVSPLLEIAGEEQEAFDSLPEGLQYGERGERMLAYVDEIEGLVDMVENLAEKIRKFK